MISSLLAGLISLTFFIWICKVVIDQFHSAAEWRRYKREHKDE